MWTGCPDRSRAGSSCTGLRCRLHTTVYGRLQRTPVGSKESARDIARTRCTPQQTVLYTPMEPAVYSNRAH
eukprot:5693717-Lingulodinium_polyedra.AAC.1